MNDKSPEELIIRWMDGETLPSEEFETLKKLHASDPTLVIDPKAYSDVKANLKEAHAQAPPMPDPELFQTTLMDRIAQEVAAEEQMDAAVPVTLTPVEEEVPPPEEPVAEESPAEEPVMEEEEPAEGKIISPFKWIQLGAAMAACFILGIIVSSAFLKSNRTSAAMASYNQAGQHYNNSHMQPVSYTAYENIKVELLSDDALSVILVDGLDAIPDNMDLFALEPQDLIVDPNTNANNLTAAPLPTPLDNSADSITALPAGKDAVNASSNSDSAPTRTPIKVYPQISYPDYEN